MKRVIGECLLIIGMICGCNKAIDKAQMESIVDENITKGNLVKIEDFKQETALSETISSWSGFGKEEGEEQGKQYVDNILDATEYEGNVEYYIYKDDYDRDGDEEAFIAIGKKNIEENGNEQLMGDIWYTNSYGENQLIQSGVMIPKEQSYYENELHKYLFITFKTQDCINTNIYTIKDGLPVEELESGGKKEITENGDIICYHNGYDLSCDVDDFVVYDGLWSGQTRKPYYYKMENDSFVEVEAQEVKKEEIDKILAKQYDFPELKQDTIKQYILRDNGILNVNEARWNKNTVEFGYITYKISDDNTITYLGGGEGFYYVSIMHRDNTIWYEKNT